MWWIAVTMQSLAGPPAPVVPRATSAARARCETPVGDEVVVCARRDQEAFRLRSLPERFAQRDALPKAEVAIAGKLKMAVESEAGQATGGGAPPRAMVRLKLPF